MERLTRCLGLAWLLIAAIAQGQEFTSYDAFLSGFSVAPAGDHPAEVVAATQPEVAAIVEGCDSFEPPIGITRLGRPCRVSGGYEFGWFQPRFTENVAVVVSSPQGDQAIAFDHPFALTPRVWAGIENARCAGFRARFWEIDIDAPTQVTFAVAGASPLSLTIIGGSGNLSRTATANVGDAMTSDHHLEMRTIDLEGTQRIKFARTDFLTSFGLRYAKTHQRSHAVVTDGTGALTELVCQDLDFDGFGPTASLEMKRRLFSPGTLLGRFVFFANARGSLLVGQQRQEIVLVTGGGATLAEDEYVHDDLLPIAELVGGLQLQAQPFGHGCWTIRTGYRAESWFATGGPVDTNSNLGLHGMILSIACTW